MRGCQPLGWGGAAPRQVNAAGTALTQAGVRGLRKQDVGARQRTAFGEFAVARRSGDPAVGRRSGGFISAVTVTVLSMMEAVFGCRVVYLPADARSVHEMPAGGVCSH